MDAIKILMDEHRVIEQVLDCLDRMADQAQRDGAIEPGPARDAVDFFRNFADRCHHGKEEDELFPMMEAGGYSRDSGPTAVMRIEHDQGRELVGRIERSIDGASAGGEQDLREFVSAAREFGALLRTHIEKEDHCLFPMAERALDNAAGQELLDRFARVEHDDLGPGTHERYLALADRLADRFGVPRASAAHAGACGCGGSHAAPPDGERR